MKQTVYLFILCTVLTIAGCSDRSNNADSDEAKAAWQRYIEIRQTKDLGRTLAIIDTMESSKYISTARANFLRGITFDKGWQMRLAEHYYKKAFEDYSTDPAQDWHEYAEAGYRWSYLRYRRGDTEGALGLTSGLLTQAEKNEKFSKKAKVYLLMLMADCQIQLHQADEARHNWQKAYEVHQQVLSEEPDQKAELPWASMSISSSLFAMGDLEGAQEWLERCEQEFDCFMQQGDSTLIEEWKGHIALKQALYKQATGYAAEAAAIYAAVPRSRIFEPHGYIEAAEYAMAAGRYNEAAYWYEQLDSTYLATDGAKMTFDNIATRLAPLYSAYRKAGRQDDALVIADSVSAAIDSALVWQKKNDAAELAVIYQTHERDLQLKDLRFTVSLHRIIAIAAILIILLIGYLLWRAYKYNKVLAEKNRRLLTEIEQREQKEQKVIEQLKAEPVESLSVNQQLFRRICDLMDSPGHIYTDTELDRSQLAQLLGTNEHYVSDAISSCCDGKSVNGFLNEYRVRYAAHLLATTTESVAVIAELSGFARSSFFRIFSEAYGMSPADYRQVARK